MAETMVERMPLIEGMEVDNENVETRLEIRQRKKVIIGTTDVESKENDGGHIVYFDQDKGVWKCRHCTWTSRLSSLGLHFDLEHLTNGQSMVDNEPLITPFPPLVFTPQKDVYSTKENKDPNGISVDQSYNSSNKVTDNGSEFLVIREKKKEREVEEAEQQVADYDVERVIAEQETHDLFCPNCRSCITKRVILRKRKRTPGKGSAYFPLPDVQPFPSAPSEPENAPIEPWAPSEAETVPPDQEVFRCLSCFSFFVPTDGGFNIFRVFGKSEENSNLPSSHITSGKKVNCISFLFGSSSSNNKDSETDNDSIPTGSVAKPPVLKDGNDVKLPDSTFVPSDDSIRQPLLPNRLAESSPTIPTPETPAIDHTVVGIYMPEVPAPTRREWDILKSIVYGGLIESITSLSVVSSAAGAGSSTLNVCALGLANLVSGLFLISHDLSELKRGTNNGETTEETQSQYYKKLGMKENFKRHAFFSILSFIIFGLVAPIVYGFAFRESDNKENKIIAVAASTLPCIAMLALGKAHVNPQKGYFRSLFYYIGLALPASGLGYVAGVMIDRLFEQYGLFDQGTQNIPSVSFVKSVRVDF